MTLDRSIPCRIPVDLSNALRKALEGDGWYCSPLYTKRGRMEGHLDKVKCTRNGDRLRWSQVR